MTGRLTLVDEVQVPFAGDRSGDGPLTLGQRTTLHWTQNMTAHHGRMMPALVELAGVELADVYSALGVLFARHESLRTTYLHDGEPVQRVQAAGELTVAVYEVDDDSGDFRIAAATQLAQSMREAGFDVTKDLPLKVAVVTRQRATRFAVLMFSHMAVDFAAMMIVVRQLEALVADPAARVVEPVHQPLDQAADEESPRGRRRAEAALRYWERQRSRIPQCLYAVPVQELDEADDRPLTVNFVSRAAPLAIAHITERTGSTVPMVVLAAVTAVVSRRAGQRLCPIHSLADNRLGVHLREYVGTIAQDGLVVVDADTPSFDELIRRTGSAMLNASRHSLVDTVAALHIRRRIDRTRGIDLGRDFAFNNTSPHGPGGVRVPDLGALTEVRAALAHTELRWTVSMASPALLSTQLLQLDDELHLMLMSGDPGRAPARELELLARGVEALLVAAAAGDVDLARLGEVTGVEPVARSDRWSYVDSCWVDLDEVQRLLDDVLPHAQAQAFVATGRPPAGEPDGPDQPVVTAYLVRGEDGPTPEQAHDACMAALPGRITAMAPGYYVICEGEPADRSDLAAWRRQSVWAEGDGRTA